MSIVFNNCFSQFKQEIHTIEDGLKMSRKVECSILFQMKDSTFHSFEDAKKIYKSDENTYGSIVGLYVFIGEDSLLYLNEDLTKEIYTATGVDLYKTVLFETKVDNWLLEINHYPYTKASDNAPDDKNPFFSQNYIEEEAARLNVSIAEIVVYVLKIEGVPSNYVWRKEIKLKD